MKYVSMRIPEAGPFGDTFFEARVLAIVLASLVNNLALRPAVRILFIGLVRR